MAPTSFASISRDFRSSFCVVVSVATTAGAGAVAGTCADGDAGFILGDGDAGTVTD